MAAAKGGCTGCFIDQANVAENVAGKGGPSPTSPAGRAYAAAHLEALTELDAALAPLGGYSIYNHLGVAEYGTTAMMIEDFAASEKCVRQLQTLATRGFTVQAHAGHLPANNTCVDADTSSLAAFLAGAGDYHFYHCAPGWSSNAEWPAVPDYWLDWRPEYDFPLGAPTGPAHTKPSATGKNATVFTRAFASGTRVEFDGGNGQGTIWWAHGKVQRGEPTEVEENGCRWESM